MKSLNWSKIPAQKILVSSDKNDCNGRDKVTNVWALMAQQKAAVKIDYDLLEGLFCQPIPKSAPNSKPGSPLVQRKAVSANATSDSEHPIRRNGSKRGSADSSPPELNLLDQQKALNVNIFLKQYRESSGEQIIHMIRNGDHVYIGSEGLTNILKLLPSDEESKSLYKFSDQLERMPVAEKFLLMLIQIPQYALRIECMLLREEFESAITYLEPSIDVIKSAAQGMHCLCIHSFAKLNPILLLRVLTTVPSDSD